MRLFVHMTPKSAAGRKVGGWGMEDAAQALNWGDRVAGRQAGWFTPARKLRQNTRGVRGHGMVTALVTLQWARGCVRYGTFRPRGVARPLP